jgi:hypothetical protein
MGDWRRAESEHALSRPTRRESKAKLRKLADQAQAEWVKRNGKDEPSAREHAPAD